ncbi:hypothetical protein A3H81_04090 [Candidatus Daviesbacteria bacterium RIFCSPLOWO2_02_FULL_38_18]|uniref:Uncharacterized protein n=1 Tax=Candidatus Daviesbacteria bacterium GW2011_GWF2_38_6 TaxID=1618432 RepID=A0A0G0KTS8_9BACT|nr:MAG: hypothetical protein US80_C0015G0002 [Candidatus Daviesbacteria bacterium GW2011_GWA2_38_17]KKQ78945.1 MAG: hypothetical protein US99_C0007G0013 [Candidatus Daviesbacteria bacterium GW2011_GWF2_38_6]OGE67174.1 MAG: hypothetical protein A3H81_04090 [Candidatus Daviesbacteria bacterium RIFCSPLOWO2_02_FULL_38_18]OGE73511.1 MAG: hypothetical protein A3H18_02825 [Candidatus Daviesbacteria bacterium RIFCSPLOWO2_12_FULL_38_10]HCB22985.1 hypothetical protein [Candidatus Daviesbacteria bacterium
MLHEQEPQPSKRSYSLPRRVFLSAIFAVGAVGCSFIPDRWSEYHYAALQGTIGLNTPRTGPNEAEDQFFKSRKDFLRGSAVSQPRTILFSDGDGRWNLQIAAPGDGWVPRAFTVMRHIGSDVVDTCVAESAERFAAYQRLFEDFEERKIAPLGTLRVIMDGEPQNCSTLFK